MRILYENRSVAIVTLETWHLMQLFAERADNIAELRTLIVVFRQKVAATEGHSPLFRDNLAGIVRSIDDMEENCTLWQREMDALQTELRRRTEAMDHYSA